jgi:hypothetical protein
VRQYRWRRLITIAVVASLLLGLAATGLGIDALRKIGNGNASDPATSIALPTSGATLSGLAGLSALPIGPNVTAVDFLATGGSYHDTKIAAGGFTRFGWASAWRTTNVPNGTYEITSVGYNAAGQSTSSASVSVKVKNP